MGVICDTVPAESIWNKCVSSNLSDSSGVCVRACTCVAQTA